MRPHPAICSAPSPAASRPEKPPESPPHSPHSTERRSTQTSAKTAHDVGQEAVSNQCPIVDPLILDLWDTIEYNLRANDPTSLRRKAREWGVTYDNDETEAPVPPVPPTP